jgi:hypothetical protein
MHPEREPYCSNCGYKLTGLTESSKCPECGRPLVEILTRLHPMAESGKRFRSKATIFGLPVLDIAIGPKHGEPRGKAKGFIAIGDMATGALAIGGLARGVVAIGGMAIGLFSMGGMSIGLIASLGGFSLGGLAAGGGALGFAAAGGGAVGYIAQGGGALGYFARGGSAIGVHRIDMSGANDAMAQAAFDQWRWLFGPWPMTSLSAAQPVLIMICLILAMAGVIATIAFAASRGVREPPKPEPFS